MIIMGCRLCLLKKRIASNAKRFLHLLMLKKHIFKNTMHDHLIGLAKAIFSLPFKEVFRGRGLSSAQITPKTQLSDSSSAVS